MRGFVREALSLATWVIAIWIAATFTPRLAAELPSGIESEAVRQAIGFGILFVLSLMVGALINTLISQLVKKTGLSGADRVFGVIFGILRGGLIILVFVVIGGMTPMPEADWWQSSVLLEWFESTAMVIQDYIPQDLGISYQPVSQ
jgi:membrane protein required for colicin V production